MEKTRGEYEIAFVSWICSQHGELFNKLRKEWGESGKPFL